MFKNNKGASLAQYGLIIALVSLGVIPIYFVLGQTIVKNLTDFYNALANNTIASAIPSSSTTTTTSTPAVTPPATTTTTTSITDPVFPPALTPGSLGGTPTQPVKSCQGDMCVIDYGNYIFNGIPANFSQFVETSGTTAGTDVIVAVLDDIVQAAENGNIDMTPEELAYVKTLANRGHELASGEREIEDFIANGDLGSMVSSCVTQTDQRTQLSLMTEVLYEAESQNFYMALYDINQSQMNPTLKNMLNILGDQIQNLYSDFDSRTGGIGAIDTALTPEEQEALRVNYFATHTVSNITNIDSAIICGLGNAGDTGVHCN